MAPRIKKPANRQLGSHSFDTNRFKNDEAELKYEENFGNRAVVIERFWQIDQFSREEFMLEQNFEGRQWLNVAKFHAYCVLDVVKEFFANFKDNSIVRRRGREKLTSWVRGVDITLTPDDFADVFQIPRIDNPEFKYPAEGTPPFPMVVAEILDEGKTWDSECQQPASILKDKYWALHMFSCSSLLPQNRNSDCTPLRARLIYAIGMGMTLDLASFMWHQIAYLCEHPTSLAALPFGGALTEVFRRKGANIPDNMPIASGLQPFNITSHAKSRGLTFKKKRRIDESGEEGEPVHDSATQPVEADVDETADEDEITNAELATQIGALAERMSVMEQNQEADHQLLQRLIQGQQTQTHLLQSVLDHMRESYPPPPPQ